MKIAVVHDYFTQLGGAEKVASELMQILPDAALYSTVALPECMPPGLQATKVETTWMQRLPHMRQLYRLYFLFYPLAVGSLDLSAFDLVISSSSGYVKGVHTSPNALHVCYCHTPMRWVWSFDSYSARGMGSLARMVLPSLIAPLRRWDLGASRQPDYFIANSKAVAMRIRRAYGREAEIIHPPIDVYCFRPAAEHDDYYLILARLVAYKNIDLAVEVCTKLGRRLLVIGDGPDRARLESLAGPTVTFLGRISDEKVKHYAAHCRALIFPGEEDFGMAPVEIAAAGRPTIALRAGGAIETIVEGITGLFFEEPSASDLAAAMERFEARNWSPELIRQHAMAFSLEVFERRLLDFLDRIGAPVRDRKSLQMIKPIPSRQELRSPANTEALRA